MPHSLEIAPRGAWLGRRAAGRRSRSSSDQAMAGDGGRAEEGPERERGRGGPGPVSGRVGSGLRRARAYVEAVGPCVRGEESRDGLAAGDRGLVAALWTDNLVRRSNMGRLFGTDGVRGVANVAPMTAEMALEIGRATAYVCKRHKDRRHQHRDRQGHAGQRLHAGERADGGHLLDGRRRPAGGPMPTPGIAFITHSMRADAGMVISASHNPYQDNGIKIFSRDGFKLPDAEEDRDRGPHHVGPIRDIRPTADEIGKAKRIDDAMGRYIVFCKNTFPEDLSLEGMKIVLDCANGATYKVAPDHLLRARRGRSPPSTASRTESTSTTAAARSTRKTWRPRSARLKARHRAWLSTGMATG